MEGFQYVNIFETKGIEYLVIIAFLLLLIPFWHLLNKNVRVNTRIHQTLRTLSASILRIPQGVFFSDTHTWTYLEHSGTAKVGLDDLLLHLTGDIRFISTREPGETIRKGEILTEIEQNGKRLQIASPISGTVIKANPVITESPGTIADDPYKQGWIAQIKPSDWRSETQACYLAEEATAWSRSELDRFRDFLSWTLGKHATESSMAVLQDGGELCDHTLSELPGEVWQDFQKEFLDPKK